MSIAIKNDIYPIINELTEVLCLENEPKLLLEAALDSLCKVLGVDGCWIQLLSLGDCPALFLAASRGLTPEVERRLSSMELNRDMGDEIVGLGHRIVLPDLYLDGKTPTSAMLKEAGFCSLVAVPITTYRIHGVLGVAYREPGQFGREFPDLLAAAAGVIGLALVKSRLNKAKVPEMEPAGPESSSLLLRDTAGSRSPRDGAVERIVAPGTMPQTATGSDTFREHSRRVREFIQSHRDSHPLVRP